MGARKIICFINCSSQKFAVLYEIITFLSFLGEVGLGIYISLFYNIMITANFVLFENALTGNRKYPQTCANLLICFPF